MDQRRAASLAIALAAALLAAPPAAGAQDAAKVARHADTGQVRFMGSAPGRPIARPAGVPASAGPEAAARAFVRTRGRDFGVADPDRDLAVTELRKPLGAASSVRFEQRHRGIPVVGGELVVNLDGRGNVLSAGGELSPAPAIGVTPNVTAAAARQAALAAVAPVHRVSAGRLVAGLPTLAIYDNRLLGGPGRGRAELVWRLEVTSPRPHDAIRELVLVDALTGKVALRFNQVAHARNRRICDGNSTQAHYPCTAPVRVEGQAPSGVTDVDNAYDFSGDTYDFMFSRFGRDSLDGRGMKLLSTVRFCPRGGECPYRNAFWDLKQMVYGPGYASADDTVGHEFGHGLTQYTSRLLYYYQSGAINESMSDIFGEFVDLTNGRATDTAAVRWHAGEDLPRGTIRNLRHPTAYGQPDRMQHALYTEDEFNEDVGGVHTNSGVGNKAAFLMTDGGPFNGVTVGGIGLEKVARIYYEAQTALLTSASNYRDLYDMLPQACANLVGTYGITATDCTEVQKAVTATEMHLPPLEAAPSTAPDCTTAGQYPKHVYADDLETPSAGRWVTSVASGGAAAWYYPQNSHGIPGFDATYATSGTHNLWGDDPQRLSDSAIEMASGVQVPAAAFLTFRHSYQLEGFIDFQGTPHSFDGGLVEYSVAGGPWTDAEALFTHGGYNGVVNAGGPDNPLTGRRAFVRESYGYGASRLSLSALAGQSVRFRFRIATNEVGGGRGWYVDDVRIHTCSADTVKPVAKAPVRALLQDATLGTSPTGASIPVRITWAAATDDRALPGELRYKLQRAAGAGSTAYADVTGWINRRSADPLHLAGQTYRYRVLARDRAGNVSAAAAGNPFTPTARQENAGSIAYTGTWLPRVADSAAFGGYKKPATAAGAKARMNFTGARSIGVVLPKAAALGTAQVCVFTGTSATGTCRAVDLSPASTSALGPRRMAFVRGGLNPATTYRIEVSNAAGRIELDGFVLAD